MSTDIAESLPKRKFAPAPMVAKGAKGKGKSAPPAAKGGSGKGASEEGSEKRIRQAVYDIRYRARREDIDLKAAFAQYMSNSSLSQADRTAVREKIFGKTGGMSEKYINSADELAVDGVANALYKVFVEKNDAEKELELAYLQQLDEEPGQKYKVRVTDKNGKSYVRFADRAKITELRGNPNIESVEMTEHGEPYEGERKKGKMTAKAKGGGLDPVGKEDGDVDNDGDKDSSDSYLLKRRKAIAKAMAKEEFIADAVEEDGKKKKLDIMKGKNNIKILTKSKTGTYDESVVSRFRSILAEEDKVEDKKKKEKEEVDPRGMKTAISLYKNKLRAMGMKMEHHQKDADGKVIEHDDEELQEKKGIEIGHIFQLGQKYSEKLNAKFSDKDGQLKNLWMGCYGIGVTRIAQAAIEQNHDQKGICWPIQISPFEVIIIPTNLKDPIQRELTEQIYNYFLVNKINVLLDDRNDRAGVKFKDAELIGIPFQIIIGRDSINKQVELLCRTNNTKLKISTDKLLETFISESEIMYNKKS